MHLDAHVLTSSTVHERISQVATTRVGAGGIKRKIILPTGGGMVAQDEDDDENEKRRFRTTAELPPNAQV